LIYFDHNATTSIHPEVLDEMMPYLKRQYGNPASNHRFGRKALTAIEEAREKVANSVNAHPSQVVFTSSGTESNNLIINGIAESYPEIKFGYSAIEHPCISEPIKALANKGFLSTKIPVSSGGLINLNSLENNKDFPNFISLMMVNNETGIIQDMPKIISWAKKNNIIVHNDAVQALGKIPLNFIELGADAMTVSSHKIYGPQGIAALILNKKIDLMPFMKGGGQEKGLRSGTENLAGIVGFGKACERVSKNIVIFENKIRPIQEFFEDTLEKMGAIIFGRQSRRINNTTFFAFPKLDGVTLLTALDKKGFSVASGSACSSNNNEPSHVLLAMGIDLELAQGAIRFSMGVDSTLENVEKFLYTLKNEVERLKQLTAMAV
jgi:cysteine desulfurase